MIELREELAALIAWNQSGFEYREQTEIDAIGHRIKRMSEIIRRIREIAEQN